MPHSITDRRSAVKILSAAVISAAIAFSITACSSNAVTENKPAVNASGTPANTSGPKTPDAAANDLAGTYTVDGKGTDGKDYKGELLVPKRDAVYQMSWTIGEESYDGVAVRNGNTVAASYTTGSDGKGCGAVVYSIIDDGSLEGIWGEWGVNASGTEKAVQVGESKEGAGSFNVTGKNPNGSAYKGKLKVTKGVNDIYQFAWETGNNYNGTGVKVGDYLAAGSGAKQCGFVLYEVKGNTLEGKWGTPGATSLGTEKATKK